MESKIKEEDLKMCEASLVSTEDFLFGQPDLYTPYKNEEHLPQSASSPSELKIKTTSPLLFQPWTPCSSSLAVRSAGFGIPDPTRSAGATAVPVCSLPAYHQTTPDFFTLEDPLYSDTATLNPGSIMYDLSESTVPKDPFHQQLSLPSSHGETLFSFRGISPPWDDEDSADGQGFDDRVAASTDVKLPISPPSSEFSPPGAVNTSVSGTDNSSRPVSETNLDLDSEEPYSKLIWKAMMSKEDYKMTLPDIYEWFRQNYAHKIKENKKKGWKGWQNSIRHNLSMNDVSFIFDVCSVVFDTYSRLSSMSIAIKARRVANTKELTRFGL